MGCPHTHETMNRPKGTQNSRVGLRRFRLDGLAYLQQRVMDAPGVITTKAFRLVGTSLHLNIGRVSNEVGTDPLRIPYNAVVAVIDGRGGTIAESVPISEDGTRLQVAWARGQGALADSVGAEGRVQLRITLHGMALYAFQWS